MEIRGLHSDIHRKEPVSQGIYIVSVISINNKVKRELLAVDEHCYIPGT